MRSDVPELPGGEERRPSHISQYGSRPLLAYVQAPQFHVSGLGADGFSHSVLGETPSDPRLFSRGGHASFFSAPGAGDTWLSSSRFLFLSWLPVGEKKLRMSCCLSRSRWGRNTWVFVA